MVPSYITSFTSYDNPVIETISPHFTEDEIVAQRLACPRAHSPHSLSQDSSPVNKVRGPKRLTLTRYCLQNTVPGESCLSVSKRGREQATTRSQSRGKRGGGREGEARERERNMQKIDSKCTRECTLRNRRMFLTIWH